MLAGHHVRGSPIAIHVHAAQLLPQACQLLGLADYLSTGDAATERPALLRDDSHRSSQNSPQ